MPLARVATMENLLEGQVADHAIWSWGRWMGRARFITSAMGRDAGHGRKDGIICLKVLPNYQPSPST